MKSSFSLLALLLRTLVAGCVALAAWSHTASAQTPIFSTNFDNYTASQSLSGQQGWTSDDLYTGASYNPGTGAREIGQSENVESNTGYATSTSDLQPYVGGAVNTAPGTTGNGAVPGHPTTYVYNPFSLGTARAMQFDVDFAVSQPGTRAHDSFGFTFQNGGATNLFSVNFVPTSGNLTTNDNISITAGGVTAAPVASFTLGSRYHLTVNVNITAGTFAATIQPETATGTLTPKPAAFTGTITDVAATWTLANTTATAATTAGGTNSTAYAGAGSNSLLFDNYAVTVPEPSTYVLFGSGAAALALGWRRRRIT